MRGKKGQGLIVLLVIVMVFSVLTACSKSNPGESKAPSPSAAGSAAPSTDASVPPAVEPITFSFFSADPNPNWANMKDETGLFITEKTGVTLDAEFNIGDPAQKVALIAASGDYPDLISAKGDVSKLVEAGAMLDLTDLIEQHAPHIKKVLGSEMGRLKYSAADPAIYTIPSYDGVGSQAFNAGGGFELQHAVVKELGYPEIRTVQDFENAIKAYKDKYPTIDGQPTIGLSLIADDWLIMISVTNPAMYTTGVPDDGEYYINPQTHEAIYHYRRPEEKEYFKWLNHMNAIGLLDPESFTQKADQYKAKIATGRVLGLSDQDWSYGDGERALKAAGKFDRGYGHYPVTLSETYKDATFTPSGLRAGYGIGISVDNPDPVRAIQFLDWLASDEGQLVRSWGLADQHYKVDAAGKRSIPAEINESKINDATAFQKKTGIGNYSLLSVRYGDGVLDESGQYYTTIFPEQIISGFNEVEKEVLAAYKAATWKDLFTPESELVTKPWGALWDMPVPQDSELAVLEQRTKEITWSRIPEMILAKPEQFDALWEAYMQELDKAGAAKMEAEKTKMVKERLELWGVK